MKTTGVKGLNVIVSRIVFLMALVLSLISCSEDEGKKEFIFTVEDQPSAKPGDDAKSSGVYKGTFVGSSGSFKLIVEAGQVIGYLVVDDNEEFILTTNDITSGALNGAITNALFTDAAGKVELYFSVEADGQNPTVVLTIQGHEDIQVVVFKEKSDSLLKIFEGYEYKTYPELGIQVKGHFNIILSHDSIARVTYKSIEEKSLNNSMSGTRGNQSWASDAVYNIREFYPDTEIVVYRYYPNPENPTGPQLMEWFFNGGFMKYSDQKIYGIREWSDNGYDYADSTRLLRKL